MSPQAIIPSPFTTQPPPPQNNRSAQPQTPKDPVVVVGIPSVTVQDNQLVVGDARSTSTRSYTPLKVVGDGSFGTVWLCDWHGTLPPNTPLSAMQCGAGAKREYAGKRLVAVKRMKKKWEGGWDECKKLKELESLRAITYHPNIIPLYDFFLLPQTKELYFVFESMEGNLYQLIKTRKGKPLAGGLVSSIFRQVVSGLHHIHASGYFHRDMKPENLLVTTTGLYDYRTLSPIAPPDAPLEKDVVVIVKLADFGLARETRSKPPYTEYVSTRWYRAPEVLLKSRDYSNPVDTWALGTIMAELVNLRPLFPGQGEMDQVARICELLGDPVDDYGLDNRGKPIGGGRWPRGVKMAKKVGFEFQKIVPKDFRALFDPSVPPKLVDCISDLLKYDPDQRLTSLQCLEHPYLIETTPLNHPPPPPTQPLQTALLPTARDDQRGLPAALHSISPRHLPPSHTYTSVNHRPDLQPSAPLAGVRIPDASSTHRTSFFDTQSVPRESSESSSRFSDYRYDLPNGVHHVGVPQSVVDGQSAFDSSAYSFGGDHLGSTYYSQHAGQPDWDAMDVSPQTEGLPEHYVVSNGQTEIQTSPMAREYPARPVEPEPIHDPMQNHEVSQAHAPKLSKLAPFGFAKKSSKWGLSMFGGHSDKCQVQGQPPLPPVQEANVASAGSVPSLKRTQSSSTDSRSLSELSPIVMEAPSAPATDAKSRKKEAERMKAEAEKQRRQLAQKMQRDQARAVMEKQRRMTKQGEGDAAAVDWHWLAAQSSTMSVPPPSYRPPREKGKQPAATGSIRQSQSHGPSARTLDAASGSYKADDSSSWRRSDDERVPKARRREYDDDHSMSSSDLPSGMSVISFATVDSDPGPTRSRYRTSTYAASSMGRMTSMNSLRTDDFSLRGRSSTSFSLEQKLNDFNLRSSHERSASTSVQDSASFVSRRPEGMHLSLQPPSRHQQFLGGQPQGHPPSPGVAPKSAINPIFKVPPLQGLDRPGSLPPFSHLEAVADGEYPPLSPMSFTSPDEIDDDMS
ncbi:kinase-like domain-containing protein [Fomitopsis serialis]|uniref:kinase-like domain-containing protein n=1 Tax=Fomitopsis serialis TaxID=139415 RepID=UPI00200889AE|nr:kinase-like domain-containing protein [Neoantrodia serialis]KAH9937710.1 kinase-like domain-containing protein [Neoantrodia serialis]